MSLTKLTATAAICAVLTAATDAHSWGPERRKVLTPVDPIELVDVLRDGHLQEFERPPSRTRLSMAWAQVGLENGRGTQVYDLNLGNIGPSRYRSDPWYFHSPGTRYRAFDDPYEASRAYWRVIARCSSAMQAFDDGDPTGAARGLKRCGYYGAPGPACEASSMRRRAVLSRLQSVASGDARRKSVRKRRVPSLSSGFHSPQPAPAVAGTEAVIDRFSGDFGFLSNFYESSLWYRGKQYRSVEHAYQACKASDESTHETIRNARTPSVAKRLGKAVKLPADWESRKLDLMRELIHEKFKNPLLQALLLATEDVPLVEGNTWNDTFWGVCRGHGLNWLGKVLMEERERCKKE